jgi:uncharacterized protein YndB with AHSA1/START domain
MQRIKKSIDINAPVDRAFEYVTKPENLLHIWPSLVEVHNVKMSPDGLNEFDWTYKMIGFRFHGHSKTVQSKPGEYAEAKNEGGIPSTVRWSFERRGAGCRVTFDAEYRIPTPVIGRLAEAAASKINEREAEMLLANLKTTCEAMAQPQPAPSAHP